MAAKSPKASSSAKAINSKAGPLQSTTEQRKKGSELFSDGSLTQVVSSLPLWEASNILTQRQHLPWKKDPDGKLSYTRDVKDGEGAICFWVADNLDEEHPSALASAAALAVIDTFDIRAACMHLIFAAHASQMENPWEEEFVIDGKQLEAYLGLQRRTDKNKREKMALIEEIAKQPCKITTLISWPSEGRRKGFTIEEGRLWHMMGVRRFFQKDIHGNEEQTGISLVVKAGLWAKYFLGEEATQESGGLTAQKGVLPKALLENIMSLWQHRAGAARLMVWLLFKSQLTQQHHLQVRTLMEVAYGTEKVTQARENHQQRKRLTNSWDDDLLALHEQGWTIQFDNESYPEEIQPSGFGRSDTRRPRGFFEQLLEAKIWIQLPQEWSTAQLEASQQETQAQVALDPARPPAMTPEELRSLRMGRGWSQRKLASVACISQGMISMMETGDRPISEDNEMTLRRVFDFM